jgi:RHS repeat-associated protein
MSRRDCLTVLILIAVVFVPSIKELRSTSAAVSVNNPPVAVDDYYTVHGQLFISPMQNDYDPDSGDYISFDSIATQPQHGTLYIYNTGNYTYRAAIGYVGSDSFTYTIKDNHGAAATGTVNLTIVNEPPVAVTDSYTVHRNLLIAPLQNDYDPDSDGVTFDSIVTQPQHGSAWSYNASYLMYQATLGYVGSDSFTYKIKDSLGLYATGSVNITVVNQPPVANTDIYITHASQSIFIIPTSNDTDPEGDGITFDSVVTQPQYGMVYQWSGAQYRYVPNSGFMGFDSFTYRIKDSLNAYSNGTAYLVVLPQAAPGGTVPYPCSCPEDPAKNSSFDPSTGGLAQSLRTDSGAHGPSAGDPVNLATGFESELPAPDLTIYNPSGPAVTFQRTYIANQALAEPSGYGSPGLSRGWVHNYDLRIQGTSGSWGALKLVYPNGGTETLTPQLSGSQPTGAFTTVAGAPYIVTGVSGTPIGTWQSVTITWKDQTKWKFTRLFGTTYALSQITSRTSQSLNFTWTTSRALTQVSDATTNTVLLAMSYGSDGQLTAATDNYGRQRVYSFVPAAGTTEKMLQTVSQVGSSSTANPPAQWAYTYAANRGQLLNTVSVPSPSATGNSTATINYDSQGRVSSLGDANGNQRIYTYNAGTTQVQVKDSTNTLALAWTQKFNSSRLDTGTTDATNHSTTISYTDSANPLQPTSVTDRNGHPTTYAYDSFGNLLTITTPRNVTTTYTWSYANFALGRLSSIQEGNKPATTFTYYEPSGLVQTITRPESNNGSGTITTTYTYDSLGNVLTITTPGNNAVSSITTTLNYTTDGGYSQSAKIGQPLTVTDNLGHVTHLRYDSQGRTMSVTDALGNETDFTYNLVGQLLTTTYPATGQTGTGNSHTTNAYLYVSGPLTSTTFYDESNTQVRQVTRTYGLEGETLTLGGSTESATNTYDALYRLKTLTDGNNNTTTYAYNNIGLLSSVTMPGSEVKQFTSYDNDGNLLQRIDGNNVTTNYVYNDSESLLTDIQYPATPSLNVHFTYDSFGRRSGMADSTGSQSYGYGNLDELLSNTTTYTGLAAKTISYSYYANGSRQSMSTPSGTFTYTYNAAGLPTSMTNPFNETTSWTYQNNDWLQTQTLQNGAIASYTYNSMGQVTRLLNQIAGNTISDFTSIAYDGAGNRTSVTATIPGATGLNGSTIYNYDTKNQLTQETSTRNGGFMDNFAYDSAGNTTTFKGVTKTYNAKNQQTGTGYAYDNNGNPITYGGTTLTFDPESRLTNFGSALAAGYTGDGLRAWKQNSTTRTYFLYDGIMPVLEMDSNAYVTATNSFGTLGLVSRREGGSSTFYSFDSEGNVAQQSDTAGNVLSSHLFDSHGAVRSESSSEPFGYKAQFGYYTDTETGLQLLTYRYYDPSTGRFLTRDPIGYAGGIGLYSYVTNNPVSWIDVEGRQKKAMPRQPPDDVYTRALKQIADATGGTLNPNWKITPGYTSYNDAIRGLKRIGFKKFFNPNIPHWGGSDWEGTIDGNWYHVTVGYPPLRYGMFVPSYDCASPPFVEAHYERFQPSSMEHLIDYLSPSLAPLIPTIMSGLPR